MRKYLALVVTIVVVGVLATQGVHSCGTWQEKLRKQSTSESDCVTTMQSKTRQREATWSLTSEVRALFASLNRTSVPPRGRKKTAPPGRVSKPVHQPPQVPPLPVRAATQRADVQSVQQRLAALDRQLAKAAKLTVGKSTEAWPPPKQEGIGQVPHELTGTRWFVANDVEKVIWKLKANGEGFLHNKPNQTKALAWRRRGTELCLEFTGVKERCYYVIHGKQGIVLSRSGKTGSLEFIRLTYYGKLQEK